MKVEECVVCETKKIPFAEVQIEEMKKYILKEMAHGLTVGLL